MIKKYAQFVNEALANYEFEWFDDFKNRYNALEAIEIEIGKAGYEIEWDDLEEGSYDYDHGEMFEIDLYVNGKYAGKAAEIEFEADDNFCYVGVRIPK